MPEIELHFTEYFDGETVIVGANGKELYRAERLKTDLRKSLALIARITVPPGQTTLTAEIASRKIEAGATIDVAELAFVVIAYKGGELSLTSVTKEEYRREPRGYA